MELYKSKFVRIICNISQFVRINPTVFLLLLLLFLPLSSLFVLPAPGLAQTEEEWNACYDYGGSSRSECCGMSGFPACDPPEEDEYPPEDEPPPQMMSWGTFYCNIFSRLLWVWPKTPEGLTLAGLARSLASTIPFVGDRLVYLVFRDILSVLSLIVAIKLIKVLPAKF